MKVPIYRASAPCCVSVPSNVSAILDEVHDHVQAENNAPLASIAHRLFPDMFRSVRQVRTTHDTATAAAARHHARRWSVALGFCAMVGCAFAPPVAAQAFNPEVGHPGKDVEWVPTPQELVDRMLDMAKVTPSDYLIDLGAGDGRTVITAAQRGARALGIEFDPDMVALARRNAAAAAVSDRAKFVREDIFESDFSSATVVTMFLLPELNLKLRPKILALSPGTRVVSTTFMMGDWKPDRSVDIACDTFCVAHLWIVPARIEGTWRSTQGELTVRQRYQSFTGSLGTGSATLAISNGRIRGEEISFSAGGANYRGSARGNAIQGTVKSGGHTSAWEALR